MDPMEPHAHSNLTDILSITYCHINMTKVRERWHLPGTVHIATPLVMFLMGLVGNIIALVIIYKIKTAPRLFTFYTLVAGLAWTDMTGQILTSPVTILTYANDLNWVYGDRLCRYSGYVMICFGLSTPFIVSIMAVERVISLRHPYFFSKRCTKINARWMLVAIWGSVLFFGVLPLLGFGEFVLQYPGTWCFTSFHTTIVLHNVYSSIYACTNLALIAIMVSCNAYVVVTLVRVRHMRRTSSGHFVSASRENNTALIDPLNAQYTAALRPNSCQKADEWQMVILLCVMTVFFVTCWLPLMVMMLVTIISGTPHCALNLLAVRMASVNQILDPWFYIIIRKSTVTKFLSFWKGMISWRRTISYYSNERLRIPWGGPNQKQPVSNRHLNVNVVKPYNYEKHNENDIFVNIGTRSGSDEDLSNESKFRVQFFDDIPDLLRDKPSAKMRVMEDENTDRCSNDYVVIVDSVHEPPSSRYTGAKNDIEFDSGEKDSCDNSSICVAGIGLKARDSFKLNPRIRISAECDSNTLSSHNCELDTNLLKTSPYNYDSITDPSRDKNSIIKDTEKILLRKGPRSASMTDKAILKKIINDPVSYPETSSNHRKARKKGDVTERKTKHIGRFRWSSKSRSSGKSRIVLDSESKGDSNVFTETTGFATCESELKSPPRQKVRSCEQCPGKTADTSEYVRRNKSAS